MALIGELAGVGDVKCDCGEVLPLKVCLSGGGYYLGHFCPHCGPYSRESGYFRTAEEAEQALAETQAGSTASLRSTDYQPGPFTIRTFDTVPDLFAALEERYG